MSSPSAGGRVELAPHLDQLLEVLDAPLRLDRALGLERLDVAALGQQRLEQLGDRGAASRARLLVSVAPVIGCGRPASSRSSSIVAMKRSSALTAAAPRPGICSGRARRPTPSSSMARGVADHARQRGLADAPPRRVGDRA